MSQALIAALVKLQGNEKLTPFSAFTALQRHALDELARKTGALRIKTEGRGNAYQVVNAELLATHLRAMRPQQAESLDPALPQRAANIAQTRSSKVGAHGHALHYLLVKAISVGAVWKANIGDSVRVLDLHATTEVAGAGVLALADSDTWQSDQPLWLVENQALFDRLDWMPPDSCGTVAYYGGQLPRRLLNWLSERRRASEVILFPDYDGVGLLNFARLLEASKGACSFWLMPGWQSLLPVYGSNQVWQNTHADFLAAFPRLKAAGASIHVMDLCAALSSQGLALEHESVWLQRPNVSPP